MWLEHQDIVKLNVVGSSPTFYLNASCITIKILTKRSMTFPPPAVIAKDWHLFLYILKCIGTKDSTPKGVFTA